MSVDSNMEKKQFLNHIIKGLKSQNINRNQSIMLILYLKLSFNFSQTQISAKTTDIIQGAHS